MLSDMGLSFRGLFNCCSLDLLILSFHLFIYIYCFLQCFIANYWPIKPMRSLFTWRVCLWKLLSETQLMTAVKMMITTAMIKIIARWKAIAI
jgi:hypothetical protein